jgi:ribosome-associated translation inhibitor RaiA
MEARLDWLKQGLPTNAYESSCTINVSTSDVKLRKAKIYLPTKKLQVNETGRSLFKAINLIRFIGFSPGKSQGTSAKGIFTD